MHVQFWLKLNIENARTRLGPTCSGCCAKIINYNAVPSGTHKQTYNTHTHTHTHTDTTQTHTHIQIPQSVQRNGEYKILWDFNIETDKVIEYRLSDIVCINKLKRVSDY